MTMPWWRLWSRRAAWAALVVVTTTACRVGQAPATTERGTSPANKSEAAPLVIDVAPVVERPLDVQLALPGELAPFQSVALHARITGFVSTIPVDRGSHVQAGQVVATLDAPELVAQRAEAESKMQAAQAQLASVQAKAEADRSTFERLRAASATPGVVAGNDLVIADKAAAASENQVHAARQQVEAWRQATNAIREMEAYSIVTAPFAGVVTERLVHPGALVGAAGTPAGGAPLVRLVDTRRLRLVVPVPEAYAAGVEPGASIPFSVAAHPGRLWTGRIARIAEAVDPSTRTMAVELDVLNTDGQLAPGAFCQVRWPVRRKAPSLFVPTGSVTSTTDRTFVIRVRNGTTEWVDVKTGLTSGALVEVFGDLSARRGTDEIRPDTAVRTRESAPST